MFAASCIFAFAFARAAHASYGFEGAKRYPSSPYRKLFANFCEWDCSWYEYTAHSGYDLAPHEGVENSANWAFFPLFPLSARGLEHLLHLDSPTATVLASKLEYFTAILAFLIWLGPHLKGLPEQFFAAALVAFNPYLIYGHAGYSEPLYFTICCLGFWALEQQKWVLAGVIGAALSATRFVGLAFALIYLIVVLRKVGWRAAARDRSLKIWLGLLLCPLGLVLFALFLYHRSGDALAFAHVQAAWGRGTENPLIVIADSFAMRGWFRVWSLMGVAGLLASAWLIRVRVEYGVFLAIAILLPLFSGVTWSLPRYIWWQPPLLYLIFLALRRSALAQTLYFAFTGGMAGFMVLAWFSGTKIVV